jgi:probable F420-dependent oxidoreductase
MKIGVVFPQIEFSSDPIAIRDYAQAAEALGYTHILAYDHVLGANPQRPGGWNGPYTHLSPFHEPFLLFAYMAGLTHTIEFTTGIIILPQRQTVLVAKQAAELDILSNGRLRLGVGLGWNMVEYTGLNENFHNRGKRIEEQIAVMKLLWTQPLVTFKGKYHQIEDAGINPLPIQQPIPLWFGGHSEDQLRRAAYLGDGWMPNYRTAFEAAPALERLYNFLQQAERKKESFGLEPRLHFGKGDGENWQQTIQDWQTAGATHISVNTMDCGFKSPQDHIQALTRFAQAGLNNHLEK